MFYVKQIYPTTIDHSNLPFQANQLSLIFGQKVKDFCKQIKDILQIRLSVMNFCEPILAEVLGQTALKSLSQIRTDYI